MGVLQAVADQRRRRERLRNRCPTSNVVLGFDRDIDARRRASRRRSRCSDGCISKTGTSGQCENGRAFAEISGLAMSPDGTSLYPVSNTIYGVAVSRSRSGDRRRSISSPVPRVASPRAAGTARPGRVGTGSASRVPTGGSRPRRRARLRRLVAALRRDHDLRPQSHHRRADTEAAFLDAWISNDGNDNAAVGVCQDAVEINSPNELAMSPRRRQSLRCRRRRLCPGERT